MKNLKAVAISVGIVLFAANAVFAQSSGTIYGAKVISARTSSGSVVSPERLVDGNSNTQFTYSNANAGAVVIIDLGRGFRIDSLTIINGSTDRTVLVDDISVGAGPDVPNGPPHYYGTYYDQDNLSPFRRILGSPINLASWEPQASTTIALPSAVGRYIRIGFRGVSGAGAVSEIRIVGQVNRPERHLGCWSSNIQRDFIDKMDYLQNDLKATDLWLDYVATGFPQSNSNSGFDAWVDSGALTMLKDRNIRYWLAEHESFTSMVNDPADLRNDLKWETVLSRMRDIYTEAKALGFYGLVLDAEDYTGVSAAAKAKYTEYAGVTLDAWCFYDEYGYNGLYYQRGLQVGKVIKEVWDCPFIQLYEALNYGPRKGNYWWLKGIHDAGLEIWIATEQTYGAGNSEITDPFIEYLGRWFINQAEFVPSVYAAYPFVTRVIPGFHPWNTRLGKPNYLPKYFKAQLAQVQNLEPAFWIYNEGNSKAGDPRDVLDRSICSQYGVSPEDYLAVLGSGSSAMPSPVYHTSFESNEGFSLGNVAAQGIPAWACRYSGFESSGVVTNAFSARGAASMKVNGYQTSALTLPSATNAKWFEFAFKPAFDNMPYNGDGSANPYGRLDQVRIKTVRGDIGDIEGLQIRMVCGTGQIEVADRTRGWVKIAPFVNGRWETLSFEHIVDPSGYYSGAVNVYLNGFLRGQIVCPSVPDYSTLKSIVFTGTEDTWIRGGAMYFDDVHIADLSEYVGSSTLTASVLLKDYMSAPDDVGFIVDFILNGEIVRSDRVFPDATGQITVNNIVSQVYDIGIKNNASLKAISRNVTVNGDADLGFLQLPSGDLDGDNEVTSTDLSILGLNLGMSGD